MSLRHSMGVGGSVPHARCSRPITALVLTAQMILAGGCVLSGEPEQDPAPPAVVPQADGDKGLGVDPNGGKPTPPGAPGDGIGIDPNGRPVRRTVRAPSEDEALPPGTHHVPTNRGAGLDPNGDDPSG